MSSILIKGARVIDPKSKQDFIGDILVEEDKIVKIGTGLSAFTSSADEVINGEGLIAAPGLVDMHVHLRDPGQTHKEDIITGCKAAAAGGVTSLLCMPNTVPAIDTAETVKYVLDKAKNADANVYVAGSITKGLKGEEQTDISELYKAGAIALSDDGRPVINTNHLLNALEAADKMGLLLAAHCEDLFIAEGGQMNEGEISKKLGIKGINRAAEDCGTAREIAAAAATNTRIHICHVSTKGSVELVRDAKRRGLQVTAETAPHYLLLTDKLLEKGDADYKMNPPLRTEEDRLSLIEAIKDGTIDAIATDHAPHTPEEKSDFIKSPNGSIGMETSLSAALTALDGEVPIDKVIELMSTKPAELMNIPAGKLTVGEFADIVLFDPKESYIVNTEKLHGKSKNTPFKGIELKGRVKYTICRGRIVFAENNGG